MTDKVDDEQELVAATTWVDMLFGGEPPVEDVDAMIEGREPAEVVPEVDGYHGACWAWANAQAAEQRAQDYAYEIDKLIRVLTARKAEMIGPWERRAEWWYKRVESWHRAQVAADSKFQKTVKFPTGGQSQLRGAQPFVASIDHEALRGWLEDKGWDRKVYKAPASMDDRFRISELRKLADLARGTEPGDWASLTDPDTGEVVPGVMLKEAEDNWSKGS